MVPGFVQVGLLAVAFQLLVVVGFYGYLRYRHPVPGSRTRRRVVTVLAAGIGLVAGGQLLVFGALGALRTSPLLSLRQALLAQDIGLLVAAVGYVVVLAAFVIHGRASG